MEENANEMTCREATTFPKGLLSTLVIMGILGAAMTMMPLVFTVDNDLPVESIVTIGSFVSAIAEIAMISLLAVKIYKDGVDKPAYALLACFAGVMALDLLVGFINEEIGEITSIITLISTVVMAIVLLLAPITRKIGMWLLLSVAGSIILVAIVFQDDFSNTQKWVGILLMMIYLYPYGKFLESCQKFLAGNSGESD